MNIKIISFVISTMGIIQLQASEQGNFHILPHPVFRKCVSYYGSASKCICSNCKLGYSSYAGNKDKAIELEKNRRHTFLSIAALNSSHNTHANAINEAKK